MGVGRDFESSSLSYRGVVDCWLIKSRTNSGSSGQIPTFWNPPWIFDGMNDSH